MSSMKKGLIIGTLLLPNAVIASDTYQSEFSVGYDHRKSDNIKHDRYELEGTYYLAPINVGNYPYALVNRVERVGSASLTLSDSTGTPLGVNPDNILDIKSGVAQVALARADNPLKLKLWYGNSTAETQNDSLYSRLNYYGTSLTYLINDHTQLTAGGDFLYNTTSRWNVPSEKTNDRFWHAELWHLETVEDKRFYAISGSISAPGRESILDSYQLNLSADYYFSRTLSLGGSLGRSRSDGSGFDSKSVGIDSQYFFTPRISVSGSFTKTDYESGPSDTENWGLDLAMRF